MNKTSIFKFINILILNLLFLSSIQLEQASNWQFGFQIPAAPAAEGILNFHHDLFLILVIILGIVFWAIYICISMWNSQKAKQPIYYFSHASILEMIWTIIPAIILTLIAGPSFVLLYSVDEIISALISFKIIGHQWYWSYENISYDFLFEELEIFNAIIDSKTASEKSVGFQGSLNKKDEISSTLFDKFVLPEIVESKVASEKLESLNDFQNFVNKNIRTSNVSFDSYMVNESELHHRSQRMLKVDNKLYVPIETNLRFLITSSDVLHSWAVPSLGLKLDACPGRLNQTSTYINRPGNFIGQCSEICGVNHGFMPISIGAIDLYGAGQLMKENELKNIAGLFSQFSVVLNDK